VATAIVKRFRRLIKRAVARSADRQPASAVLQIDSPADRAVITGLLPIAGWAFTGENRFPEGKVELAVDDEEEWVELPNRLHVAGVKPSAQWANRCGYAAALNTFFLSNGDHRLKFRIKDVRRLDRPRGRPSRLGTARRLPRESPTASALHSHRARRKGARRQLAAVR
jgi:hypothetical protein